MPTVGTFLGEDTVEDGEINNEANSGEDKMFVNNE